MCNVNFQKPQTNDELCQNILNISTVKIMIQNKCRFNKFDEFCSIHSINSSNQIITLKFHTLFIQAEPSYLIVVNKVRDLKR